MDEPDPQVQAVLELLEETPMPPAQALSVKSARTQFDEFNEFIAGDEPESVGDVSAFSIEGPGSDIPLRVYRPDGEGPFPVLVYLHGGGWTIGNLDMVDDICRSLTNRAECVVVSVEYRLAPEHPFPAPLADAYAAVQWVADYGETIGIDTDDIAVGGDSAGGNLTAGVTLVARDEDGPDISHQVLLYPAVASPDIHEFDSYEENAEGYILEAESAQWFYEKYLPSRVDRRNEYAAPLLARDLSGLPPATIVTAGFDPLRDEGREYGKRLQESGVDVEHHAYDGMIHGFVSFTGMLDAADDALDAVAEGLNSAFE